MTVALCSKQSFTVAKEMRWTLFARSCTGVAGNTAMTFGIALVPLVFQQTIGATVPFWASLCAFCIIGETIGCFTSVAMLVSFLGVVIIACSPYILSDTADTDANTENEVMSDGTANLIGCSLILCNALCQGLVAVTTRMMQKIHWSVILFYYSVVALISITIIYLVSTGASKRILEYDGE